MQHSGDCWDSKVLIWGFNCVKWHRTYQAQVEEVNIRYNTVSQKILPPLNEGDEDPQCPWTTDGDGKKVKKYCQLVSFIFSKSADWLDYLCFYVVVL